MNATLIRQPAVSPPGFIFGVLVLDTGWTCNTLERPWLENAPNVSCVPPGTYDVEKHISPTKGDCYRVNNVPGRTDILIHTGNFVKDTLGCILVGKERRDLQLISSRVAMNELEIEAPDGFQLTIMVQP